VLVEVELRLELGFDVVEGGGQFLVPVQPSSYVKDWDANLLAIRSIW